LIAAGEALVVNVSYYGAVSYHLDPAYGATKAGLDKLTFDMAQDFKPYKVAVVSIWPGTKATERAKSVLAKIPGGVKIFESAETPKFSGLAIASLYSDPRLMSKSGSVVIAAEAPPQLRAYRPTALYRHTHQGTVVDANTAGTTADVIRGYRLCWVG
jgi:short-subunit dehydrogenase